MSPNLNPIHHIWDLLGRRMQAREPPVENIRQLEAALHREWQQLSRQDIRRLTGGMRRRVDFEFKTTHKTFCMVIYTAIHCYISCKKDKQV
jgi:hypothetical protein